MSARSDKGQRRQPRPLPTIAERDELINVVYGADRRPPACTEHTQHTRGCAACGLVNAWRTRMYKRFHRRGLRLCFDDRSYEDDPRPPRCPDGHTPANPPAGNCTPCRNLKNWRSRQHHRMNRAGIARRVTDLNQIRAHLRTLIDAGMIAPDIARAAGTAPGRVRALLHDGDRAPAFVGADLARRLLAVPVPARKLRLVPDAAGTARRRVDATGTIRRIQAAALACHSLPAQAHRYGYESSTLRGWLTSRTVSVDAADAVAALYPTLIARPGGSRSTAALAAERGWVPARYFSPANIDDPDYQPFGLVNRYAPVRRRMRSLAWMGQGPKQVAEVIGEDPETVATWLDAALVPGYAAHMCAAAFETLSGRFGTDDAIAARARAEGWPPPLAWHDIDIDNPDSRPCIDLPTAARKRDLALESQVLLALAGRIPASELLHEEKVRVVRALRRATWSDQRIAAWLRWNPDGDFDKGAASVSKFRERAGITEGGPDSSSPVQAEAGVFIVVPSAA